MSEYRQLEYGLYVSSQEIGETSNMTVKREEVVVIPPINAPMNEESISFVKRTQNEGFTTLSAIDSFTASITKENFINIIDEKIEGKIYKIAIYRVNDMHPIPIIWNDNDFKWFARSVQEKHGRSLNKIPLARMAENSTLTNGGFILSRLIALIYKHREYANKQFGKQLIDSIINYDNCLAKEKAHEAFTINVITSAIQQIYLDYDKIREIYFVLENKEKEEENQEGKKFYLAKEVDGKYYVWDFKSESFYDQESFRNCVEPFSLGYIDSITSNFFGPLHLERGLEADDEALYSLQCEPIYNAETDECFKRPIKPARFCIISCDELDEHITEEFIPIYREFGNCICGDRSCAMLNDVIDSIDSHGYYGGSDDNMFISNIIRKYGEITPADQLSNENSPRITYYPYVSYLELRKMINAILIYNEQKRAIEFEKLSKKPSQPKV